MEKPPIGSEHAPDDTIRLSKSTISIWVNYPEENPNGAVGDVTRAMEYIGLFDGILNIPPN